MYFLLWGEPGARPTLLVWDLSLGVKLQQVVHSIRIGEADGD
jgi:hypothetical protein